jgi:hypothetical protein
MALSLTAFSWSLAFFLIDFFVVVFRPQLIEPLVAVVVPNLLLTGPLDG